MSVRATKWILWLALILTLPVPYFMIESGRVPTVRLFLFALLTSAAALAEPDYASRFVAALFVLQAGLYVVLCYALARWVARLVHQRTPAAYHALIVTAVVAGLLAAAMFDIYRAPLSNGSLHPNLLGVWR